MFGTDVLRNCRSDVSTCPCLPKNFFNEKFLFMFVVLLP